MPLSSQEQAPLQQRQSSKNSSKGESSKERPASRKLARIEFSQMAYRQYAWAYNVSSRGRATTAC